MPRPELIPLPAADAVTFRPGFWRSFGAALAISMVVHVVLLLATAATPLAMSVPQWLVLSGNALATSTVYAATFAALRWRWCRDWLRISSAGLELASRGSYPILVRWPALEAVRLVRRWGTPLLEATPTGPDGVAVPAGSPSMPRPRVRDGRDTFTVEIWLTRPGRAALRSALARHLPPSP
ncbi:hypothetical protein AB0M46_42530 [Dactylosporangium sp. NPDC051485]|uniref:hypothetical protein n=1 Tax=Dactylosporangium sp. NPDC051485 TaxID=3154846 RepID=UPI00341CCECB